MLPAAIDRGPFIAGAESEVDDFHVAAWIVRIAYVEGVSVLEKRRGPIPYKIKVFWDTQNKRGSRVKGYPDNVLH